MPDSINEPSLSIIPANKPNLSTGAISNVEIKASAAKSMQNQIHETDEEARKRGQYLRQKYADVYPYEGEEELDTVSANDAVARKFGLDEEGGQTPGREITDLENLFDIPNWSIKDYINDRASWQKQTTTLFGEPAWFYFKIFFKFDTNYGLLGGILGDPGNQKYKEVNTANHYLNTVSYKYGQEQILHRIEALNKFVRLLSYISSYAPWFFQSVKDINNSFAHKLNRPWEQRAISIELLEDAIDMPITTLFELYRYAAFDYVHDKEIIPENLRKFDMDIVLFQIPLRVWQTSAKDLKNRVVKYKGLGNQAAKGKQNNISDAMSFKLFTFQNCEIDMDSLSNLYPSSLSVDKPFQIKPSFKIKYDKVYHHMLNEFGSEGLMFGDSGIRWDQHNTKGGDTSPTKFTQLEPNNDQNKQRRTMKQYALDNAFYYNQNSSVYQALVEASEDTVSNALRMVHPSTALGNLYKKNSIGKVVSIDPIKNQLKNLNPFG